MLLTAQQKESQEFAVNTHELKDLRLKAIMKLTVKCNSQQIQLWPTACVLHHNKMYTEFYLQKKKQSGRVR